MMLARYFWWCSVTIYHLAQRTKPNGKYLMEIQERDRVCVHCVYMGEKAKN